MKRHPSPRHGFTILELSIVLVIIGMIAASIVVGQSMMRAGELRNISAEYDAYLKATKLFQEKYQALPGDMKNATSYWGTLSGGCPDGAGTGTQTCNGDGNGMVGPLTFPTPATAAPTDTQRSETFGFWKHLNNAGLIEGNYTSASTTAATFTHTPGTNCPRSKVSGAGWTSSRIANPTNNLFNATGKHLFLFGAKVSSSGTWGAVMTPADALDIDTKFDDGKPGSGKIVGYLSTSPLVPGCTTTAVASTAAYAMTTKTNVCALAFTAPF